MSLVLFIFIQYIIRTQICWNSQFPRILSFQHILYRIWINYYCIIPKYIRCFKSSTNFLYIDTKAPSPTIKINNKFCHFVKPFTCFYIYFQQMQFYKQNSYKQKQNKLKDFNQLIEYFLEILLNSWNKDWKFIICTIYYLLFMHNIIFFFMCIFFFQMKNLQLLSS